MKKPLHPVTDCAVLRYLQHVEGMDIEALRKSIGRKVDQAVEHGAAAVITDGFKYVLSDDGVVLTVHPANCPAHHIGSLKRRREFE